jgi:hypothetical protein
MHWRVGLLAVVMVRTLALAEPATAPAAQGGLSPAATPGEALARSMRAMMAEGDEAAYRHIVDIRSPDGHSEQYVRHVFASFRLRKVVDDRKVGGVRLRDAGFDRNEKITPAAPSPPPPEQVRAMLAGVEKFEWEIAGETATIKGRRDALQGSTAGQISIRRAGDGWVVVLADPSGSATPEDLRKMADNWSRLADACDAAAREVANGRLTTIRQVNDFLDAGRPAKQPPAGVDIE